MSVALALVGAYLVGSIDFAVIVARMHGVDIREVGSGNPGTSNVMRTLGKGPAAMVLIGDALKGVIGASFGAVAAGDVNSHWVYAAGLAAVIGHCYPIFHKFKGGRGVATGCGVLIFAVPLAGVTLLGLWLLLTVTTKVAAISSLVVVAATFPILLWQGVRGLSLVWIGLTAALVVWRHRSNIGRLVSGDEKSVSR